MQHILKDLFAKGSLTLSEAEAAMDHIMTGQVPPEQLGAFLGFIAGRGLTADLVAGAARSLRKHAVPLPVTRRDLIDTCGTGGDGAHTFNISTINAFLLAAAGLGVAKHGNRSVSSRSGSADVIESLGIPIDQAPTTVARMIDTLGFGFLYAPLFHPAMGKVAGLRRSLGVRTLFNILGPLANPAPVRRQVIGVFDRQLLPLLADVAVLLEVDDVMFVAGRDGLDEITITGATDLVRVQGSRVQHSQCLPEDCDLPLSPAAALRGGDAQENAAIMLAILSGEKSPRRDICLINAAAALMVAGRVATLRDGRYLAEELIDSGRALAVVEQARHFKG